MTPTEQDIYYIARGYALNYANVYPSDDNEMVVAEKTDYAMQLITADRKRVVLEARIDALEYAKISPKFKIEERIEALKQELESL